MTLHPASAPESPGAARRGFTLVETLVATSVLAIMIVAITGTLSLALSLLRAAGQVLAGLDTLSVDAVCGGLALPLQRTARRPRPAPPGPDSRSAGFTLMEVLVALGIAATLILVAASAFRVAHGGRAAAEGRVETDLVRYGLGHALQTELGRAGASLRGDACALALSLDGRRLDLWWRQGEDEHHVSYTAGSDAAGRPALYRRRHPHARQPWLEDVLTFAVVALDDDPRLAGRVAALEVEMRMAGGATERWRIDLPHRPCRRELPP